MIIALEYIICQLQQGDISVAIKSHRIRRQNPGLTVIVQRSGVTWQLLGLSAGTVEKADPTNVSATRLDLYIGRADLLNQLKQFPKARASPSGNQLSLTNPSGTERRGGKKISWRGPISKHEVNGVLMAFPDIRSVARTTEVDDILLNIDWEPAMYPLSDGKRTQVHFGIQSQWNISSDKRRTIPDAKIMLSHRQYADILKVFRSIR